MHVIAPIGMTEKEQQRFSLRVAMFLRRGVDLDKAEQLADRLVERDAEGDTRRMCIECAHLQRDGECFAARQGRIASAPSGLAPVRDVLQRCDGFAWQKP